MELTPKVDENCFAHAIESYGHAVFVVVVHPIPILISALHERWKANMVPKAWI